MSHNIKKFSSAGWREDNNSANSEYGLSAPCNELSRESGNDCCCHTACPTGLNALFSGVKVRTSAKSEVNLIDEPPKPKVDVQESISNARAYCKQNPESFVSLRDYSGGIYNKSCAAFAAEQRATDPTYKIGSD